MNINTNIYIYTDKQSVISMKMKIRLTIFCALLHATTAVWIKETESK